MSPPSNSATPPPPPSSSSSQSPSPSSTTRFPPRKNDADCWNCVGITYYNEFLKSKGEKPKCYGVEYTSGKQITPEVMKNLEELPPLSKDSSVWIIGLSQASMRMHRLGQAPLCRYGITMLRSLEYSHPDKSSHHDHHKHKQQQQHQTSDTLSKATASTSTLEPPVGGQRVPSSSSDQQQVTPADSPLPSFLVAYQKSCNKIIHHMGKVYDRCTEDFLNRFQKSSIRVIDSCNKLAGKLATRMYSYLFDKDKDQNPPK